MHRQYISNFPPENWNDLKNCFTRCNDCEESFTRISLKKFIDILQHIYDGLSESGSDSR